LPQGRAVAASKCGGSIKQFASSPEPAEASRSNIESYSTQIEAAACAIHEAEVLLIAAGAGMSADSGIPVFRGDQEFWDSFPMKKMLGVDWGGLSNPNGFDDNPEILSGFYAFILDLYRKTTPHSGYKILKDITDAKPYLSFIFTSNVDGHFQRAGFNEMQIVECFGSMEYFQCSEPCSLTIIPASEQGEVRYHPSMLVAQKDALPLCKNCGKVARPNIYLPGDSAWLQTRTEDQDKRFFQWQESLKTAKVKVVYWKLGWARLYLL